MEMCQQTLNMNGNFVKLQAGDNITSDAGSARMHLLCLAHLTAAAAASNQQTATTVHDVRQVGRALNWNG